MNKLVCRVIRMFKRERRDDAEIKIKSFDDLVIERIERDDEFTKRILARAIMDLCEGDSVTAQLLLRDFVKGTMGFKKLARELGVSEPNLYQKLSARGNPTARNLSAIISTLVDEMGLAVNVTVTDKRSGGV